MTDWDNPLPKLCGVWTCGCANPPYSNNPITEDARNNMVLCYTSTPKTRDFRKSKGLSQDQLGEMCGFHFSYIGGVERGERNISLENISKIAEALDIEPKEFFQFDEPFLSPRSEEKEAALTEVLALLKNKEIVHFKMIKHILIEIFSTFADSDNTPKG